MQSVWALGTINLKPGFLRFYCWTKDFAPHAQAQTHAQIWVRFFNLPQEYWGLQTLFEIASGLGSPITIDEATQQRRFGLFARVLIDVNLAEKMFESVVIEREDHALSVTVQYEKHPMFCSHCQMIGHNIQNCSKLNISTKVDSPDMRKSQNDTAKSTTKTGLKNQILPKPSFNKKQYIVENGGKFQQLVEHRRNVSKTMKTPITEYQTAIIPETIIQEETFSSTDDFEEGECSDKNAFFTHKSDHPALVQHKSFGNSIQLHNSFDLLESGLEQVENVTG